MTSNLQFKLLNNVGQTLVERGSLSAVLSSLAEQFAEAFPHARAVLYLRRDLNPTFTRQAAFPQDWNPDWVEQIAPRLETVHDKAAKLEQPLTINGAELGNPALFDRQVAICPVYSGSQVEGFLDLFYSNTEPIPEADRATLQLIVQQLGIAIGQNQQPHSQIQEGMDQYRTVETLRTAAVAVSSSLDLKTVLDQLLVALGNVINYDAVSIMLLANGEIDFTTHRGYSIEQSVIHQANHVLRESQIITEIIDTREPVFIDDVRQDDRWIVVPGAENVCSWIGAPLMSGEDVVGILMVDNAKPNAYGDREKWLVATLASHAAVAVQNARLHQEMQKQVAELGKLYEATATMMSDLDQASLFQSVVEELVTALQVEQGAIYTWDEVEEHLQLAASFPQSSSENLDQPKAQGDGLAKLINLEQFPSVQSAFQSKMNIILQSNSADNEDEGLATAAGLQSAILVPLIWRNEILGCLLLGNRNRPHTFTNQELRMTRTLARQAAIAIEHADLFSQARRRIQELSTIHEIALQLNTPLEMNRVLDIINHSALDLIEANNVHIFLYDAERDQFTIGSALFRDGRRKPAVTRPRKNGITAAVVHGGQQIIISDAQNHALFQSDLAAAWGIGAIAGFPLKRGDRILGAFTLTYLNRHNFTDDEILLLSLLADQAAVAVENARLFSDAQRRLRDMSALVDMAQRVTGNLRVEMVMETTVKALQNLLDARGCSIALLEEDSDELVIEAAAGIDPKWVHHARMKVGEGISGQAVRDRRPIYVRDTRDHPDFLFFDDVLRSLIAVPLISRNEVIGALTVDSDSAKAFEDSDIQLMTIAAAQVSTAIANARLYEEAEDRAAKLAVAYEELKENDRLKDELVQNVSHELRTPLTFVKGYVDLLMDGEMGLINQEQENTLQIVSDKTLEITRLIDDIMSLQRISADNLILEPFEMSRLIEESISGHRLTAGQKGLSLEFEQPSKAHGKIVADKGRVQQVLDNLLVNAIKFSPDGGAIMLSMVDEPEEVLVQIADQGIGLPAEKVDRIFERFYQVDGTSRRRFGGAGIGLAIVKRIIDAHGGNIWVESEVDQGSTFYFSLPKNLEPTEALELV